MNIQLQKTRDHIADYLRYREFEYISWILFLQHVLCFFLKMQGMQVGFQVEPRIKVRDTEIVSLKKKVQSWPKWTPWDWSRFSNALYGLSIIFLCLEVYPCGWTSNLEVVFAKARG